MSTHKPLTFEERRNLRRLAEDAISAANRHYAPFVDAVAHPLNILSLLDMVDAAVRQGGSMADTHKSVPTEPTPEMMAAACQAVLVPASADLELARKAVMIVLQHNTPTDLALNLEQLAAGVATMAPAYRAMIGAVPQQQPAHDLIRIDTILPNGMPDSEYITHDDCRRLAAENSDLKRTLLNLQRALASIPKIEV